MSEQMQISIPLEVYKYITDQEIGDSYEYTVRKLDRGQRIEQVLATRNDWNKLSRDEKLEKLHRSGRWSKEKVMLYLYFPNNKQIVENFTSVYSRNDQMELINEMDKRVKDQGYRIELGLESPFVEEEIVIPPPPKVIPPPPKGITEFEELEEIPQPFVVVQPEVITELEEIPPFVVVQPEVITEFEELEEIPSPSTVVESSRSERVSLGVIGEETKPFDDILRRVVDSSGYRERVLDKFPFTVDYIDNNTNYKAIYNTLSRFKEMTHTQYIDIISSIYNVKQTDIAEDDLFIEFYEAEAGFYPQYGEVIPDLSIARGKYLTYRYIYDLRFPSEMEKVLSNIPDSDIKRFLMLVEENGGIVPFRELFRVGVIEETPVIDALFYYDPHSIGTENA